MPTLVQFLKCVTNWFTSLKYWFSAFFFTIAQENSKSNIFTRNGHYYWVFILQPHHTNSIQNISAWFLTSVQRIIKTLDRRSTTMRTLKGEHISNTIHQFPALPLKQLDQNSRFHYRSSDPEPQIKNSHHTTTTLRFHVGNSGWGAQTSTAHL